VKNWQEVWKYHSDIFIVNNWQECSNEIRKDWRLPAHFSYFSGGETALRVGIVVSETLPREDEFLLAGMIWAKRLSNGAKTVIYFVAPDFSPFLLQALNKIGGAIVARGVYWREKLSPSLYLIPDNAVNSTIKYSMGEPRLDWGRWVQELNPVAQQQLEAVKNFFEKLKERRVRTEIKQQSISFIWGSIEIAELKRKGKRFELLSKAKWEKDPDKSRNYQRQGWVDSTGMLNHEFTTTLLSILDFLEDKEKKAELKLKDCLSLYLHHGGGIISTLWGSPWEWPWLPKDRGENWVHDLGQWFYFQGSGQLSVVCPILEKPLNIASQSILLKCVLEKSLLLNSTKMKSVNSVWDSRIHWLTLSSMENDLRLWLSWLKAPEQFQIWTLPDNWHKEGLNELTCRSVSSSFQGNNIQLL
jgi:hypothetical protein